MAIAFYKKEAASVEKNIKNLEKIDLRYSAVRFILILAALISIYAAFKNETTAYLWLGIALFGGFLWMLRKHVDLRASLNKQRKLKLLLEQEVQALSGNDSFFEDGSEFMSTTHFYAHDLDVLGSNSLFQHVNRTSTIGGKTMLAHALLGNNRKENIEDNQEAVKELAGLTNFRHQFRVEGLLIEEKAGLIDTFKSWLTNNTNLGFLSNPLLLYTLAGVAISLGALFVVEPTLAHIKWFSYAFMLNLGICYLFFKKIANAYKQLGTMAATLGMYAEMISLIEELKPQSTKLASLQLQLSTENSRASYSLKKLKKLLDRFDQVNNVVALIITNGLYHNHIHALRELNAWKRKHETAIEKWMQAVHEIDQLNSLANFSFNHPEYVFPKRVKTLELNIIDAAHPLIASNKRIANSIKFNKQPYTILTGSNMSGKSTFLKTIGLNLILAKAGAPVCAAEMTFYPFKILSSMKLVDSISKSESYFQAEVLKLKAIKEVLDSDEPCFLLLDEILRGTNSDDKRKGTRLFMEKLKGYKALGVLATHDVDVAELAQHFPSEYNTAFFESKVVENTLHFDYKLRSGICTTPNATMLMQGYGII